jgi:tripartite-type tricarboxylate transporter receptor subunit TctC
MKKLLVAISIWFGAAAWAQNITVVSGAAVGAGMDTVARKVLKRYDELYGTTSVVITRTGAQGKMALNYLKELPAGTAKVLATSQGHIINFDAADFERLVPLAMTTAQPMILIVRRDFPANNWDEFVDHAVKNPGRVSMGVFARASIYPWLMPMLERNRMTMNLIEQGTQNITMSVASGDLDSLWTNASSLLGTGFEDRVKMIAVTSADPIPGVSRNILAGNNPKLGSVAFAQGFYTTDDVPPELRKVISDRLQNILNSKWAQDNLGHSGSVRVGGTPDALMQMARQDWHGWQRHKHSK